MPYVETLLTFSLAALLLSISPGPSNLYIMARSINQGHRTGFVTADGMAINLAARLVYYTNKEKN